MSQWVFSTRQNLKEVDSNASGEIDVPARQGQAGKEQKLSSSTSLCRLPGGVTQIKGVSSYLKEKDQKLIFKLSKNVSQVVSSILGF